MSNTPRTDAEEWCVGCIVDGEPHGGVVDSEFSRQLEHELAEAVTLLRRAAEVLKKEASAHGHGHWDSRGTHGSNCSLCIAQREAGGWDMVGEIEAALKEGLCSPVDRTEPAGP